MTSSFAVFKEIIKETRNSSSLYSYLQNVVHPPYDYSDLLRWQWAQSVSALDKLIHVNSRFSSSWYAGNFSGE